MIDMSNEMEELLGQMEETPRIWEFSNFLHSVEEDLVDLEEQVIQFKIGPRELFYRSELHSLESEYQELSNRALAAHRAVADPEKLPEVEEIEDGELTEEEIQMFGRLALNGQWEGQLERIESVSERIDNRLTSKRNTANTRLGLVISVTAVLISAISLLLSNVRFS
jgi:hypothetical protein